MFPSSSAGYSRSQSIQERQTPSSSSSTEAPEGPAKIYSKIDRGALQVKI
jgi:hypothetical protein